MISARAAIVRKTGGPFVLEDVSFEEPRDDEVLIRIKGVGICHTDIVVRDQAFPVPLPLILGHEGSGVVEKVGRSVTKVLPGDHVALSFASCGACANCIKGLYGYCIDLVGRNFGGSRPDGTSPCCGVDGGRINAYFFGQSSFAEKAIATERSVVKIPKDVPLEIMGPLGCGLQTGAGAVMNSLKASAGDSIAVFGIGAVGMAAVMAAQIVGCTRIIAIDLNTDRLAMARELGATHSIDASKEDPIEKVREITGEGAQYSLECTGNAKVARQAVDCLRLTGVCGIVGLTSPGTEVSLDLNSLLFGRTVRGIIEGDSIPDIFIPQLIEHYRQGAFPFDRLIRTYHFDQINGAVAAAERGDVLKAIIVMPDEE